MKLLLVSCLLLYVSHISTSEFVDNDITADEFATFAEIKDPDHNRNVPELVTSRGFKYEEHFVTTEDGYILNCHRIIHPGLSRSKPNLKKRKPVILHHGLMSSAHDFIINNLSGFLNEPIEEDDSYLETGDSKLVNNNLGFELAKRGYDVWLPNSRGNLYSRNHTRLNPSKDRLFWDFTYDEMIKFDLPVVIDYILETTKAPSIGYIGHSQGSLIAFGLLSTQPEKYRSVLKPVIALAPVATLKYCGTPIRHVSRIPFLPGVISRLSPEFAPKNWLTKFIADRLCSSRLAVVCSNIMFLANGYSTEQLDIKRVGVYANHYPAGTSTKNVLHYRQGILSGKFLMFDHGKKNFELYGSDTPPQYPLHRIPPENIILMHSKNDLLASPRDVYNLIDEMGGWDKLYDVYEVPHRDFNHLDFVIAKDSGRLINFKILQYLKKFED